MEARRIEAVEPWVFIFFGLFHLHRIWALVDRDAYARFWLGVMDGKGVFYYVLMGFLALLCVWGIVLFFQNLHSNYWWRWAYLLGGGYVLFDLFAIAAGLEVWQALLRKMFDASAPYWNLLWGAFIVMGGAVFSLGIYLAVMRRKQASA